MCIDNSVITVRGNNLHEVAAKWAAEYARKRDDKMVKEILLRDKNTPPNVIRFYGKDYAVQAWSGLGGERGFTLRERQPAGDQTEYSKGVTIGSMSDDHLHNARDSQLSSIDTLRRRGEATESDMKFRQDLVNKLTNEMKRRGL